MRVPLKLRFSTSKLRHEKDFPCVGILYLRTGRISFHVNLPPAFGAHGLITRPDLPWTFVATG
jgi:hypothetical protein